MQKVFFTIALFICFSVCAIAQINYLYSSTSGNKVVGGSGMYQTSPDNGLTWTASSIGTLETLNDISEFGSNIIVTGYFNTYGSLASGIYRSTNSGASWTMTARTPQALQEVVNVDGVTTYVAGNRGTLQKSTDGGQTWFNQSIPSNFPKDIDGKPTDLWGMAFSDANHGVACGKQGVIILTNDGGLSWIRQTSNAGGQPLVSAWFASSTVGYCVGYYGTIIKTVNGGTSWAKQTSGTFDILNGVCFTDANNGVAVGATATILRTNNGGATWVKIPKPATIPYGTTLYSVSFSDANIGIISCSSGIILRTTDGGGSWVKVRP